ncbi:MAG TPA: hypothetical protein VFS56_05910, partial [Gemmatimonadaceae bacterium]|nr:hypothetical protein [Gemmatimonadaceae bacterium]
MTTSDSGRTADDDGRVEGGRAVLLITYVLRGAGVLLLALVLFPVYRLLDRPDAGLFLRGSIGAAELSRTMLFLGSVITIAVAVIISRSVDTTAIDRALASLGRKLAAVPTLWFAGGLALITFALTLAFSLVVLEGKPNLVDAMVQLVHGRFIAAGKLAGPGDEFLEFWQLQNSLVTPNGWVSQYPPGYVTILAAGLRLGMVQLVGPLLAAMTVLFTALAAQRLLREDMVTARLGAVMLCFCPFLIGLAGAFMNHVGAAAFSSAAVYLALRSRDGGKLWWALLTGLAVGIVLSIRPLSAVVATAVVAIVWLGTGADTSRSRIGEFLKRSLAATLGISPLLVGLAAYNQFFFGSPLTFGYTASQGPLVGPGFHRDPTGAIYGPIQAIGFTSSDLIT